MPAPKPGESRKDFISRCVPVVLDEGTAGSQDQAVAICQSFWDKRGASMEKVYATFKGAVEAANVRNATFQGSEHLVVPIIALIGDSVIWPMNAPGPELVPAREVMSAPSGWNGRPVIPDHPGDGKSSANSPETLEALQFGTIFNSRFDNNKLKMEAWLDLAKASKVGSGAEQVIEDVKNGNLVEVSVGAYVQVEKREGVQGDKKYTGVWHNIVPDHLAMGLNGNKGACSVEGGCGGPRLNKQSDHSKLLSCIFRSSKPEGLELTTLFNSLWAELELNVPAFDYIAAVYPDSRTVIYSTSKGMFQRTYSAGENVISLEDDEVAVEQVTEFRVRESEASEGAEGSDCAKCGTQPADINPSGDSIMNKDDLVRGLIENESSPFGASSAEALSNLDEATLSAMSEIYKSKEPATEAKSCSKETESCEANLEDSEFVQMRRTEYEEILAMAKAHRTEKEQRRASLMSAISGAQEDFTEDDLKALSIEQLEKLNKALKVHQDPEVPVVSYLGKGLSGSDQDVFLNPPRPYDLALAKAKEKVN